MSAGAWASKLSHVPSANKGAALLVDSIGDQTLLCHAFRMERDEWTAWVAQTLRLCQLMFDFYNLCVFAVVALCQGLKGLSVVISGSSGTRYSAGPWITSASRWWVECSSENLWCDWVLKRCSLPKSDPVSIIVVTVLKFECVIASPTTWQVEQVIQEGLGAVVELDLQLPRDVDLFSFPTKTWANLRCVRGVVYDPINDWGS